MGVEKTRAKDYPLHDVISPAVYSSILPELVNHGIRWVGDIADATGTSVWNAMDSRHTPQWWSTLKAAVTHDHSSTLPTPVSPNMDPIFPATKHRVGSLVFLPNEKRDGTFEHVTKGHYYKVTGHTTDEMNRPQCKLLHLKPLKGRIRYAAAHTTDRFHKVTSHSSVLYLRPRTVGEIECEVDLLNVQYTTLTVNTTYSPQSPQRTKTHWL